ncbi:hypothetical protein D1816_12420 [Aquimarina sp. AD10]|uniref:hypothetical protein n=1 Tax=Aquimarina sp. AD10 TaxID=1714849 RepID=UPI000E4F43BE|nr:hypothetical protein [Aquimarina sp. AD10]AXT61119.1 hypothetical protein D1816_12420 [Aquimarina sp. AD10]
MKKYLILILLLIITISCDDIYIAKETALENSNQNFITKTKNVLDLEKSNIENFENKNYGDSVVIYNELVALFSPDNFECGLSDKIKNRLKKSKREGKDIDGFIPDYVANNSIKYINGIKLNGRGANVLVHYFTYEKENGVESKPIISQDSPSQINFNAVDFIDDKNENYNSFYFTMDCAGFFSASVKASAKGGFLGIGKVDVAAEGENTINQSQSIIVMRVLIHSPLYSAYIGNSIFRINEDMDQNTKNKIYQNRVSTLKAVLNAIPTSDRLDTKEVYLNANYEAIITSNKGSSGYNGKGELNSNVQINFTVQASGQVQANNSVSRKTEFSSYNTYILEKNVDVELEKITIQDLNSKIASLSQLIQ